METIGVEGGAAGGKAGGGGCVLHLFVGYSSRGFVRRFR